MATYAHSPLTGPRSIRLIQVASAAEPTTQLQCKLLEACLDSNPTYNALSYSWDAQRPSHPIECEGATLYITENCATALQRLRNIGDCQTLWIDSICIDQTSVTERSEQVALMRDIYKQAAKVIVWLGEEDAPTKRAIQCLEDIALMTTDKDRMERGTRILFSLGIEKDADDPIGPFFLRSWFSRMWTIQEVTLPNPGQVYILCGTISMPWVYLILALEALRSVKYRWGNWHSAMRLQTHLSTLLDQMREKDPSGDVCKPGLLEILTFGREKDSTDPKDRVFALYGVLQELGILIPPPNYAKSLGCIYAEATIACFKHDASMQFLFQIPSDDRRGGLPSWVVDWGDRSWPKNDSRAIVATKQFCASGSSSPSLRFIENDLQLAIRGHLIDLVEDVGRPLCLRTRGNSAINSQYTWDGLQMKSNENWSFRDTAQDVHNAFEIFKSWVDLAENAPVIANEGDRQTALRDTLLEYSAHENDQRQDLVESFPDWYKAITKFSAVSEHDSEAAQLGAALQSFMSLSTGSGTRYQFRVMQTCRRKRFIVTKGRKFGVVADIVKEKDLIALFAGLTMPVILRPKSQGMYQFVCHAYVQGLMAGEGWEQMSMEPSEIRIV